MTTLYTGVSPAGDDTLGVEHGVYLRLGSHVSDPSDVDEASHFPSVYSGDLAGSDGIFISSVGSYLVESAGPGHIEVGGGLTQKIRDGDCDTSVESGDITIETAEKGFSLTAKDNSSFLVETSGFEGIAIEAPDGKVSSKANTIYNHTYGAYLKQVVGCTHKLIERESTNVSLSWVIPLYLTVAFSLKACSISVKVAEGSVTVLKLSSGVAKLGAVFVSKNVITHDMGYSIIYFKARGIQLEYAAKKEDLSGWKDFFKVASMGQAMAETDFSSVAEAFIGINSKMPGA